MNIYKSKTWIKDLDLEISHLEELNKLNGKTIVITGSTGLICSAVADLLFRYNECYEGTINIVLAGRSNERVNDRFSRYVGKNYFHFVHFDATDEGNGFLLESDYIIHGASNASPNKIVEEPVETMTSNIIGLKKLLDCARINSICRVLYVSSSEVYGNKVDVAPFKEQDYGYIDLLNPRNSYSVAKRASETLCVSYSDEYNVDTVIVRPGHIYGPTSLPSDNRVSSIWPHSVVKGEPIIMKSDGSQIRSYCYCLDCAAAILKVLVLGEKQTAYNISNPNSIISIKEMAQLLVDSAGTDLIMEAPSDLEVKGFNPMSNSSLDSTSLIALGWQGLFDGQLGFSHTVQVLTECQE